MADPFTVDPDAIVNATQQMGEFLSLTQSVIDEIDALVTHLHYEWSGCAAAAHAEAHRRWTHGEALMRDALTHLRTAGHTAHHNYTRAMATNSAMWS